VGRLICTLAAGLVCVSGVVACSSDDDAATTAPSDGSIAEIGVVSTTEPAMNEPATGTNAIQTTTTAPATTTEPPTAAVQSIWPWHEAESAHPSPADAVDEFMDFVGFVDGASQGQFQQGDSRSGEIEIDPYPDNDPVAGSAADNPSPFDDDITTVLVRLDDENNWVVIGSVSAAIVVDEPRHEASVSSPLDAHFTHNLMSDGVVMQLWPDGATEPIVDEYVTNGGGVMTYDVWDATVEWAPSRSGPATVIFSSMGGFCPDPACEPLGAVAVTAFRVELAN